jgi:hypothetical protein
MTNEIQRLPVSVALVAGGAINLPILVEVRPRETKHGGRPVEIVDKKLAEAGPDLQIQSAPISKDSIEHSEETPKSAQGDWYGTVMNAYEELLKQCKPGEADDKPQQLEPEDLLNHEDSELTDNNLDEIMKRREKK